MAVLVVCVLSAGCFWRSYGARMDMHTDLLLSMTHKGADLVRGHRFAPENLPELLYPLDRAREFAARAHRHGAADPPASLGAFDALLAAYAEFCRIADDLRHAGGDVPDGSRLSGAVDGVEGAAGAVRRALAAEGR